MKIKFSKQRVTVSAIAFCVLAAAVSVPFINKALAEHKTKALLGKSSQLRQQGDKLIKEATSGISEYKVLASRYHNCQTPPECDSLREEAESLGSEISQKADQGIAYYEEAYKYACQATLKGSCDSSPSLKLGQFDFFDQPNP